jgi:hypothetical protein
MIGIVTTRIQPSTLAQGEPFSLPTLESAGSPAVAFRDAGLAAVNADAARTGIQVLSCK